MPMTRYLDDSKPLKLNLEGDHSGGCFASKWLTDRFLGSAAAHTFMKRALQAGKCLADRLLRNAMILCISGEAAGPFD